MATIDPEDCKALLDIVRVTLSNFKEGLITEVKIETAHGPLLIKKIEGKNNIYANPKILKMIEHANSLVGVNTHTDVPGK